MCPDGNPEICVPTQVIRVGRTPDHCISVSSPVKILCWPTFPGSLGGPLHDLKLLWKYKAPLKLFVKGSSWLTPSFLLMPFSGIWAPQTWCFSNHKAYKIKQQFSSQKYVFQYLVQMRMVSFFLFNLNKSSVCVLFFFFVCVCVCVCASA